MSAQTQPRALARAQSRARASACTGQRRDWPGCRATTTSPDSPAHTPDHCVRNPYLWQLVEAGALAGKDGDEVAKELRMHPRIAPWAAWPHALVRRVEKMSQGALEHLPLTHRELVVIAGAGSGPGTSSEARSSPSKSTPLT